MLTDVDGVAVGHWTSPSAHTGCSVVLLPEGSTASGEIRGGAPATRDFALLDPTRLVNSLDAVVLAGGSAFGLSAVDGVVAGLAEAGRGFATRAGPVPIVVGMALYDLSQGDVHAPPGPDEGRLAMEAADHTTMSVGLTGAGTGATVDKWSGQPKPGGIGTATIAVPAGVGAPVDSSVVVSALVAVNAFGAIDDGGNPNLDPGPPAPTAFGDETATEAEVAESASASEGVANTTIGCIVTNAQLDKFQCHQLAQAGHDGLARSLRPAHTPVDGDALVAASTGQVETSGLAALLYLRLLAEQAVVTAVRSLA